MDIQLNFINQSNDFRNSQIVIFQKNVATNFDELAVAWRVIEHCDPGENHPFTFPIGLTVSTADAWGNYTPQLTAENGQLFQVTTTASGDMLVPAGSGTSAQEIQVLNNLARGAISAALYRDRKLVATKTSVAPQQKAVFQFKPTLWIGVASQLIQGQVMDSPILSQVDTEISLLGVASADIVMTGGGPGPDAKPFEFSLQNVTMA